MDRENIKASIIALEEKALKLWNQGDPDGFLDLAADEVVYMDPSFENKLKGKNHLEDYYSTIRGKIKIDLYRMIDPTVQLLPGGAVLSYNYEAHRDGTVFRMNCTEVYGSCPGGVWRIIHTHWSFIK